MTKPTPITPKSKENNLLTLEELEMLIPVIDIGIKTAGLQIFMNDGGAKLQSAVNKLQEMAQAEKTKEEVPE